MTGPSRFQFNVLPRSLWALPVSVSISIGRGHTTWSVGVLCFWAQGSWGPDFRIVSNPAAGPDAC